MTTKTRVAAAPTTPWRNRITGSGEEAPDQLLANPANWRIHPKAQQDALAGALDAVGWVQQVLVNRRSGFVVDGHARVALALTRGEVTVPVLYVDLEPEEEALVLATLDPIGAMAGRDDEKLRALLADVCLVVRKPGVPNLLLGELEADREQALQHLEGVGARGSRGAACSIRRTSVVDAVTPGLVELDAVGPRKRVKGLGRRREEGGGSPRRWETRVADRTYHDSACPYHMGVRVHPAGSLAAYYPWLALEWHPTRNALRPDLVTRASAREIVWHCELGHQWSAPVYQRTLSGTGCPDCYRLSAAARTRTGQQRARRARDAAAIAKIVALPSPAADSKAV